MRHRPSMVNERANGSETGTGIENGTMAEHANWSESETGIKNETMTECTNGSESENRIVNGSMKQEQEREPNRVHEQ